MQAPSDTIAAIATPPGAGAIGIVRVSGPEALLVVERVFRPAKRLAVRALPGHSVVYGQVVREGERLDEALLLVMRAPHSYTTEDMAELQCHGGLAILRAVLNAVLAAGARPAQPGEFTLRAYLAGRIDLAQAEAVLALVQARTDAARRIALSALGGKLSAEIHQIERLLLDALAAAQAVIDYPEEDLAEAQLGPAAQEALERMQRLLATARASQVAQHGARVAVIGRPNVGKSSLLNVLVGFERALVSPEPGTTRDYLEVTLELGGAPLTLVDTAGLRESASAVEAAGIARTQAQAQGADLILLVLDGSQALTDEDHRLLNSFAGDRAVLVRNKTDLPPAWERPDAIPVSALTGAGLAALRTALAQRLHLGDGEQEAWLGNERQHQALERAKAHLETALASPIEIALLEVEAALDSLGEVTGRTVRDEVIQRIFSQFCVGK